ncbi:MAG: DUF1476 domain-containing protein [Phycisphaerales bacterium]|nr:DUF1476 domain-containing protein [Phycisphaerales bacterium]
MSGDGFEKRQDGFETKFEREQDAAFRQAARRDKAFARWAAARMGIEGDAVDAYEKEVIKASLEEPGDDDILGKVGRDLDAKGCGMPMAELRAELERANQNT